MFAKVFWVLFVGARSAAAFGGRRVGARARGGARFAVGGRRVGADSTAATDPTSVDALTRRRALGLALAATAGLSTAAVSPRAAVAVSAPPTDRAISSAALVSALGGPRKTIVITGANSGVGLEGAKLLAAAGHDVVCACRTRAKAELAAELTGGRAAVCDLADLASVRAFAKEMNAMPALDVLALNAGVALNTADKVAHRTADGFELTIGTNHLGHFLLYSLLEKKLAKPGNRLIVTASPVHDPLSGGGNVGSTATLGDLRGLAAGPAFDMVDGGAFDADKAYKDSKLCNMLFTAEAARRLATSGATANAFSPGLIPSPSGFFKNQNQLFANVFSAIAGAAGVSETAAFGGACLAFMTVDPSLGDVTDGWWDTDPPGKHQLRVHEPSTEARDVQEQIRLWELSEKLVGLA